MPLAVLASSPTEIHRFQSYCFWVASWDSAIYDILKLIWYIINNTMGLAKMRGSIFRDLKGTMGLPPLIKLMGN